MNPERTYYPNGQLRFERWKMEEEILLIHRLDEPAFQGWHENGKLRYEEWRIDGHRHRVDGPAFQHWANDGQLLHEEWWIEGDKLLPIEDPIEWTLFIAKNWGNVHGLEKYISENLEKKAASTMIASVRIL